MQKINRRSFVVGSTMLAAASATPRSSKSAPAPAPWNGPTMTAIPNVPKSVANQRELFPEIIALNRMAFGPRPGDIERLMALGSDTATRLAIYIEEQLAPQLIDDSYCDQKLAERAFVTLEKPLADLWATYTQVNGEERHLPFNETRHATFIRAIYSERQLLEVLTDHWHNHFNVYGSDHWVAPLFSHYDREVIRRHVLGNFRQMLEAVATSPQMLHYLDNQSNTAAGPNENFARELFELHTMGAENYLGVIPDRSDVPLDEQGRPVGYIDKDVYQTTEAFTGWKVDRETGQFTFDSGIHSRYDKTILNVSTGDFQGIGDGKLVLNLLAAHPGTARFICRKLCRRLVSDQPSEALVEKAAMIFQEQIDAYDQLKQVVQFILLSDEFRTTWGQKVKRPFEYCVSILRATQAEFEPDNDILWNYDKMGQPLFRWGPPNGYPDNKESWLGTMPMLQRWRFCDWLMNWSYEADGQDNKVARLRFIHQMPNNIKTPVAIVDYWINRLVGYPILDSERFAAVEFMAYGRNPEYDLPDDQIEERLRYMVALLLMSSSFQLR